MIIGIIKNPVNDMDRLIAFQGTTNNEWGGYTSGHIIGHNESPIKDDVYSDGDHIIISYIQQTNQLIFQKEGSITNPLIFSGIPSPFYIPTLYSVRHSLQLFTLNNY